MSEKISLDSSVLIYIYKLINLRPFQSAWAKVRQERGIL